MKDKTMIIVALTGAVTPKDITPHIPTTPEEIAADAIACWKAGASVVHLHMRDDEGKGIMCKDRFKKTVDLIRADKDCDIVICCTSSGSVVSAGNKKRMEHFESIPEIELGSYDAGTINWACGQIFENSPQFLEELAQCYLDNDVKPEVEIFDMGMITNTNYYIKKGLLKTPIFCQFVLGVLGGAPATVDNLVHLVRNMPEGAKWSAFGVGRDHLPIMYAALALGADGIRVGIEDNVYYSKGVLATNTMFVERAVRVVKEFGKTPTTSAEAREILGIKPLVR